jgi:hypothetical protein
MVDVTEEKMEDSSTFGDVAQGDFVFVKLVGKKGIFYYTAEAMKGFDGNEYEIRYYTARCRR